MEAIDNPERLTEIQALLQRKKFLREFYKEIYRKYRACVDRCPVGGVVLELGSGGGFCKEIVPEAVTSDVIPYAGVDQVIDAKKLPFADGSVRAILLQNVLHHIDDAEKFFAEVTRTLMPGGRIFMMEPYTGGLSKYLYKHIHHEGFDPGARQWAFAATGPLSSANTALPWIIFERDRAVFEMKFPQLHIVTVRRHSPLRYWLSGGMRPLAPVPGWLFPVFSGVDSLLARLAPAAAGFFDVECVKVAAG